MTIAKALIATAIAGLTAVGTGLTDGHLTSAEVVAAIVAALVALGAVYGVPNAEKTTVPK